MSYASAEMAPRRLTPLLLLPALCAPLVAAAPQEADGGVLVQVRTASRFGESSQGGRLMGWTEDGPRLEAGQAPRDWVRLDFPLAKAPRDPAAEDGWVLQLSSGLHIPGRPQGGDADRISWAVGQGANLLLVPVDLLAVRGFGRGKLPVALDEQEEDLLVLRTELGLDRRSGWLEDITAEGIQFAVGDRVEEHAWERIEGLLLFDEQALIPTVQGQVLAFLQGGASLPFAPRALEGGQWVGELPWGGRLRIPAASTLAFERWDGPFLDLCSVMRHETEFESGKLLSWEPRMHRSVAGRPLTLDGVVQPRGIGVRAPTTLGWQVGEPGLLTVSCGVDAEVAGHRQPAPLRFQVLLDDELLFEQSGVELGQGPQAIRVEVPRAGMLRLRCLSEGDALASGRHGNWIAPRYWFSGRMP